MSSKSEKEIFNRAMNMVTNMDIKIKFDSVRLNKYYSFPTDVDNLIRIQKTMLFLRKMLLQEVLGNGKEQ
ncbi:hypothetical protein J7J26_03510 [Candidatus Micrarchaeota archaeon]|nr:hypothetical protein [Candidatus Micrarchaeota archaeon]